MDNDCDGPAVGRGGGTDMDGRMTMKLYLVVSEELWDMFPILDDGTGPKEYYRIAELIVARSAAQARYLAWQTDSSFSNDIRDMPRFSCRKKLADVEGPARVASREYEGAGHDALWV